MLTSTWPSPTHEGNVTFIRGPVRAAAIKAYYGYEDTESQI